MKKITLFFLLLISNFALLTFNLLSAEAFTMSNSSYILETGNFNTVSGKAEGSEKKLGITVGETASGLYTGTNYKVCAGFQCVKSTILFSFSIDQTSIDFGPLSPTNPVTRTNTLTISNGSATGYNVTASQNQPLTASGSGAIIPDTTCDGGACSETASTAWISTLTYGFGYRCDNVSGTNCTGGFSDSNYYKQFADNSKSETPQVVMRGKNIGKRIQSKITYKLNISGTQQAGTYSNIITYIATPTF